MKRGRIGGRKALTVVELLIVIIIVGILALIAIPRYTNYVERKRITKATRTTGAIVVSQMMERYRKGKFYSASTIAEFKARGIDISDTKFFTYETVSYTQRWLYGYGNSHRRFRYGWRVAEIHKGAREARQVDLSWLH